MASANDIWFGDVTIEGIVRAGLIGQQIGNEISLRHFREDVGTIANQTDRGVRALPFRASIDQLQMLDRAISPYGRNIR